MKPTNPQPKHLLIDEVQFLAKWFKPLHFKQTIFLSSLFWPMNVDVFMLELFLLGIFLKLSALTFNEHCSGEHWSLCVLYYEEVLLEDALSTGISLL